MELAEQLKKNIAKYHLLNHPFYQAWMKGELSLDDLRHYTVQYFPHVKAFPRYVSAVHSFCENDKGRRQLLENLMEEEGAVEGKDHPQLWKLFGRGLDVTQEQFEKAPIGKKAQALVSNYWASCRSSYAEGLAALYAYEYQVPEIAKAKIEGLKKNYNIDDPDTLAFFSVHETADRFHSESCAEMLNELSPSEKEAALKAGESAAKALWDFLTEVHGCDSCPQ